MAINRDQRHPYRCEICDSFMFIFADGYFICLCISTANSKPICAMEYRMRNPYMIGIVKKDIPLLQVIVIVTRCPLFIHPMFFRLVSFHF